MSESFRYDPDAVRGLTEELLGIAADAARTAGDLRDALTAAGMTETAAGWGDDEMGRAFAAVYLPSADEGVTALENSADVLHEMGSLLAESLAVFDSVDNAGVRSVRAGFEASEPAVPDTTRWAGAGKQSAPADSFAFRTSFRTAGFEPEQRISAVSPAGTPGTDRKKPGTSDPRTQPAAEGWTGTTEPATDTPAPPANGRPDESEPLTTQQASTRSATGPSRMETPPAQAPRGSEWPATSDRASARTPWSRRTAAAHSPAERREAPASLPRVSAPEQQGGAPRGTGSERRGDRKQDRRLAAGTAKPRTVKPPLEPSAPQLVTDAAVMRIIEELAARHGLRTIGFDTAGLDEHTAREIAAAVDQVLERHHVIDLRVLEIADLDAARPAHLDRPVVSGPDQSETRAAHILLDRAATNDPIIMAAAIEIATGGRRTAPGSADRPVYATLLRELGRALAAAAGHAAHRQVQRTLIAEYLRTAGPEYARDPLSRVVSEYRQWRDRLGGCSPAARFDPEAALVEAFTEVEIHAGRASEPALALHRLLAAAAPQQQ